MTSQTDFDILMIGHFAKDRLVVDGKGESAAGGAVYYGGVAVRRLGVRVAVATRLHPGDFPLLEDLKREGVEVFAAPAPATTGIENIYNSADMERRICRPLAFAGAFRIEDMPRITSRVCLIVPLVAGEVDLPFLEHMAAHGPVGMDVQGFVRVAEGNELVFKQWPDMRKGLAHITYLKVDKAEAELLTGETDLAKAAQKLAALGPREIVLTQLSGVTVYADGQIYQAPFTPRNLTGRTGRGDTCFGTYVAKRLSVSPDEACRWAGAVTTLKQERPGPWRGSPADVEALLASRS